jgi:hypothetical protein
MSALVIKAWTVKTKPVEGSTNFISIIGRQGGLVAWLLSVLKIDPTTSILMGIERLEFRRSSLAGTESRMIPLEGICSAYYGYHKPWKVTAGIVAAALFLFVEAFREMPGAALAVLLIGLAIAFVYYFLNRELTLGFVEHSGHVSGIRFKRSIIENLDVNEDQARLVCSIAQKLIEAKRKKA